MDKLKVVVFGFAAFLSLMVILESLGLPDQLKTFFGFIGGVCYLYSIRKFGWIKSIRARK